jgi:hypothetical protein
MSKEDELKKREFLRQDIMIESATVGETVYVRESDGTWRYADTWIRVPGARDKTLTEHFQPKLVISELGTDAQVERVVVDGGDVSAHPELLDWCLEIGTPVRDEKGKLIEVLVPYEAWRQRDRIPSEIVAPENSEDPAERELAIAERQYREAEHTLEQAAAKRAALLRQFAGVMTREKARSITGLSVGRVQQLIRSGVELDEVERMILRVIEVGKAPSTEAVNDLMEVQWGLTFPTESLKQQLNRLRERGLVETTRRGYRVTSQGRKALKAATATEPEGS